MPKYQIETPEGKFLIESDVEYSDQELNALVNESMGQKQPQETPSVSPIPDRKQAPLPPLVTKNELGQVGKNILGGAVRGAADIGMTALTPIDYLANKAGVYQETPESRAQAFKDVYKDLGIDENSLSYGAGKIGTQIAGTLGAPGAAVKALNAPAQVAAKFGKNVPQLPAALAQAIRSGGMSVPKGSIPKNLALRTAGGATAGGVAAGMIDPEDAAQGAAIGGTIGALAGPVSAAFSGASRIKSGLVDPYLYPEKVARSVLEDYVPDEKRRNAIIQTIDSSIPDKNTLRILNNEGERFKGKIPGVNLTVAQKTQDEGLSALEHALKAKGVGNALSLNDRSNNAALINAMDRFAKDESSLNNALKYRDDVSAPLYEMAYKKEIPLTKELIALLKTPDGKLAYSKLQRNELNKLQSAFSLPKEKTKKPINAGISQGMSAVDKLRTKLSNLNEASTEPEIPKKIPLKQLDELQQQIKDMIKNPQTYAEAGDATSLSILRNRIRDELKKVPEYDQALTKFAQNSKPVNKLQLWQALRDKYITGYDQLSSSLEDGVPYSTKTEPFISALKDKNFPKKATGYKHATYESVLDPEEINILNAIKADDALIKAAKAKGRGVGSDTARKLLVQDPIGSYIDKKTNPIDRIVAETALRSKTFGLGDRVLKGLAKPGNEKMQSYLADILANDPRKVAELLSPAQNKAAFQNKKIEQIIKSIKAAPKTLPAATSNRED